MNKREALKAMADGKKVTRPGCGDGFFLYLTDAADIIGSNGEFYSLGNFENDSWYIVSDEQDLKPNQLVITKGNLKPRHAGSRFPIGTITTAENVWEFQENGDFQGDIKKIRIDENGLVWEVQ